MTGLFGGAFDPPHNGHLALARTALESFSLAALRVLVVARPGHRAVTSAPGVRLALAQAAFAEVPGARVELDEHAFTVDLLREHAFDDPLVLIGADQLAAFGTWKEPDEVLRRARLGVATRPGYPREALDSVLARLEAPQRVLFFELPPLPVSSSEVRALARRREPFANLVPAGVREQIERLGLYRDE
ncbi:MAG: nicotinate-nicotinamide nucleotide adenylyltransferase [Actinobacteria bacterium]|nr:nicotinate-nicotinamide nucleotide adenylyltransferase [Actinomycetota bacterium]